MRKVTKELPAHIAQQIQDPKMSSSIAQSKSEDRLVDSFFRSLYGDEKSFVASPRPAKKQVPDSKRMLSKTDKAPFKIKYKSGAYAFETDPETGMKKSLVPRLVVPRSKPHPGALSSRTIKPTSMTQNVEATETIEVSPRAFAANEHLAMFDDESFDDPEFLARIIKDIKDGKQVMAHSLYYTPENACEWRSCEAIKYEPPMFTIKWMISGRTKEVPRISLRFDCEDLKRFERRRELAIANRREIDLAFRESVHLFELAKKQNNVMDQRLVVNALRKLTKEEANSELVNKLIQEVQEQYNYAMAMVAYAEQWSDQGIAKTLKQSGLKYYALPVMKAVERRRIKIPKMTLPDYATLKLVVDELFEIESCRFLDELRMFCTGPMILKDFIEHLKFGFETKIATSTALICKKLMMYAMEMIEGKPEEIQGAFVTMINLRYKYSLSRLLITMMRFAVNECVMFKVCYNSDLTEIDQSCDYLVNCMNELLDFVRRVFVEKPPMKISPLGMEEETLVLEFDELDVVLEETKGTWERMVKDSFDLFAQQNARMKEETQDIPSDMTELCNQMLPAEWNSVVNGGEITTDLADINYSKIADVYSRSLDCYDKFQLNYGNTYVIGRFRVDISQYRNLVTTNVSRLREVIFTYLGKNTDSRMACLSDKMDSISAASSKTPDTIEEWYERHCLLLELRDSIGRLEDQLNEIEQVFGFMDTYQFEPEHGYSTLFEVKHKLLGIAKSITSLSEQDDQERMRFMEAHIKSIEELQSRMKVFYEKLHSYHQEDPTTHVEHNYHLLLAIESEFKQILETVELYQQRNDELQLKRSQYDMVEPIQKDINLLLPIWTIAQALDTDAESWLATIFRQLNVQNVTDTLVGWEKTLKATISEFGEDHPMLQHIQTILRRVEQLIVHLPIVRVLCNPNFRGRHWTRISKLVNMTIGPNEGITWNWLIDSGIEDRIAGIAAISRAADMEYQIEKTIAQMIDDLTNLRLKVVNVDGVMKLDDPTSVVLMLSEHQTKMQEIFLPPYVNPFLTKLKEYDVLARNLRQIIKQTLETQEKIEELQPAMKSTDVQTQHEDMCENFKAQVSKFNDFTTNFKLSLSFHQIVSNQRYVDLSQELADEFKVLREQLDEILEEKRKKFPRFMLLSDKQLVKVLTYSDKPSKVGNLFTLMYPALLQPTFENELLCTGFVANDNTTFSFVTPVTVTPEAVETWFRNFDLEIKHSMKTITKQILDKKHVNLEKICRKYPSQITCLVSNIHFTSQVNMCLRNHAQTFADNRDDVLTEQLNQVLESLDKDINLLVAAQSENSSKAISAMLITLSNSRKTVIQLLKNRIRAHEDPNWYSKVKYVYVPYDDDYNVYVHIGPCRIPYSFEFVGNLVPNVQTLEIDKLISGIMLSVNSPIVPIVCGCIDMNKVDIATYFAYLLGKQSLICPCVEHTSIIHLKKTINKAALCELFLIFADIPLLNKQVLNDLSVHILELRRRKALPHTCATFSFLSNSQGDVPESIKMAFCPIIMKEDNISESLEGVLLSMGVVSSPSVVYKLNILTTIVSKAFPPPSSSILAFKLIKRILEEEIHYTGSVEALEKDIHDTLIRHVSGLLKTDDVEEVMNSIDHIFNTRREIIEPVNANIDMSECSAVSEKVRELLVAIENNYGVVLIGPSLSGKSFLISLAAKALNITPVYVNPIGMDPLDLFGDVKSGLLSAIVPKSKLTVFDGTLQNSWMEIVSDAVSAVRRLNFGDGTTLKLKKDQKFIFETDNMSGASPSTIANCVSFYIGEQFISLQDRLAYFARQIEEDDRLVEPLSNTIVGSQTPASELTSIITRFSQHFIPVLEREFDIMSPITFALCLNNYFHFLKDLILSYFVPDEINTNMKHTAQDLLCDAPNLGLFALFWSFAGAYVEDDRKRVDDLICSMLKDCPFKIDVEGPLAGLFFDGILHVWRKWDELPESGLLRVSGSSTQCTVLESMADVSPEYLMIPNSTLFPALLLSNILLAHNSNVLIYGSEGVDKRIFSNLILHSPYVLHNFSASSFSWSDRYTHRTLKDMVASLLPDPHVSQGWSLRKPLLALTDFDAVGKTRASELMRFMIENDCYYNDSSYAKDVLNGIRFVLSCNEVRLNQRLVHHMFFIRIASNSEDEMLAAVSQAVNVLWEIQDKENEIAKALVSLLRDVQTSFKFNIRHLLMVLQRVAIVQQGRTAEHLGEAITHEAVRVFYDPIHEEDILAKINLSTRVIAKACGSNYVSAFDVAGKRILSNINNSFFRPVGSFIDVSGVPDMPHSHVIEPRKSVASLKFTTSQFIDFAQAFQPKQQTDVETEFDILAMTRTLTTPKTHSIIYTQMPELCQPMVTKSCDMVKAELHHKRLNESLMQVFHESFIQSGMKKAHHVLFIDINTLKPDEEAIISQMLRSPDVFGLFRRGEKLRIMTELYAAGIVDPDGDNTLEAKDGYNNLLSEFLTDCETYFHLCIVMNCMPPDDMIANAHVFQPFYESEIALRSLMVDKLLIGQYYETVQAIRKMEIFQRYPYLVSHANIEHLVKSFGEQYQAKLNTLNEKKQQIDKIYGIGSEIEAVRKELEQKMHEMEADLSNVNKELEDNVKQTEELAATAEQQTKDLEEETKILKQEEIKAEKIRKECEAQLKETKAVLNEATKEVTALSSRDTAVIKGMNHPPHGVVLVVTAMCLILGQPIEAGKDDETLWKSAKKVMTDTSFLNKLISRALDPLSPSVIDQLKKIIADPNFDPAVIQRASTAAKSICRFVRAIVPYYGALEIYKDRINMAEENEKSLKELKAKHQEASDALMRSKSQYEDVQNRRSILAEKKKTAEDKLFDQRDKIDQYQKVWDLMKPHFSQNEIDREMIQREISKLDKECLLSQCLLDLCGPFNSNERNQIIAEIAGLIGHKCQRYMILPTHDPNVEKWIRMKYPLSLMWKENTAMLSPVGNRWVCVAGLEKCADSYIKKVVNRTPIAYISVKSRNFEDLFLHAMRRNMGVVLFDYDLSEPNLLIQIVQTAQLHNAPFVYRNETFTVPENFIVYIAVKELPQGELLHINVRLVDLQMDETATTEMIALRLYELTDKKQSSESNDVERNIKAMNNEIESVQRSITSMLLDVNVRIFEDKNKQWEFTNLGTKMKDLKAKNMKMRQVFLWLFDDFPTMTLMAKTLNEFFAPFPNKEKLWQIFEAQFENVTRVSSETLYDSVQKRLLSVMAAELPLWQKVAVVAESYHLKLDGSNCEPAHKGASMIMTSRSTENLPVIPNFGIEDSPLVPQETQIITPMRLHRRASHDNFFRPSPLRTDGFDRLWAGLVNASGNEVFRYEEMKNIVEQTSPYRPVICHTSDCAYQLIAIAEIACQHDKCEIVNSQDLKEKVMPAAQSGTILVTVCSSETDLTNVLAPVSEVFGCGYLSPEFRLIVLVQHANSHDFILFSSLFDKCDIFSVDAPIAIKTAYASTINSFGLRKYNQFLARLCLFDSTFAVTNRLHMFTAMPSFFHFVIASLCCQDADNENMSDLGLFISKYIYGLSNSALWERLEASAFHTEYPLPKTFNNKAIERSVISFPPIDDPTLFGFNEEAFLLFKERFMTATIPPFEVITQRLSSITTTRLLKNELFLLRELKAARQPVQEQETRIHQLSHHEDHIDMSLILACDVLFKVLKYQFLIAHPTDKLPEIVLTPTVTSDDPGISVTNLMCRGGSLQGDIIVATDGTRSLPRMWMSATTETEGLTKSRFCQNGTPVASVFVKTGKNAKLDIFPAFL